MATTGTQRSKKTKSVIADAPEKTTKFPVEIPESLKKQYDALKENCAKAGKVFDEQGVFEIVTATLRDIVADTEKELATSRQPTATPTS